MVFVSKEAATAVDQQHGGGAVMADKRKKFSNRRGKTYVGVRRRFLNLGFSI
jgi:hypothetical protein